MISRGSEPPSLASEDAVPDPASSPQPTNQGAEKRSKCEGVEGATTAGGATAAAATAGAAAGRHDQVNRGAARRLGARRGVLADHVAGGHRSARLHRDRTDGEACTGDGARGRRLCLANHIRHRDWSGRGRTARDDEVDGQTTRHARAGSRALADHVAGGHRSARLHRDRTEGEARADDGARGRRLHLANHIRHQHSGRRRGPDLHIGLGVAHHNARVDDADGHAELGMVVGDLEITALAHIEVGAAVVHDLLAVEPRLEEAVRAGRPLHVIHEVVPDVLGDRADRDAVVAGIARAVDGVGAARHMELEARGRGVDHEVGLSAARGRVVKVEERAPVPDRSDRWGHIARGKHERVRPPLVLSLVAVGRGSCEHQIGAVVRAAASDIDVTRLRSQLHRRGTVAPGTHDRGAIGRDRL